jgi:hypothetical protein
VANREDFFSEYLRFNADTEIPAFFSRWTAIVGIGALLERNFFFRHGHMIINPNMYAMLIGSPGTKKSTAIKLFKSLLIEAGYGTFSPNKTSKEKFLAKLSERSNPKTANGEDILEQNLGFAELGNQEPVQCFICADEFNNFIGNGNIEFISLLGELWDYEGSYENELKNSKSDFIYNPTISILSGNTQTNFKLAFPPESLGQGFFSRLLLVYCETVRPRITWPSSPPRDSIVSILRGIKADVRGEAKFGNSAFKLIDTIYKSWPGIDDIRFEHYTNRRFAHLLKLVLVVTAARLSIVVSEEDVIYANTILTYTESFMPSALGEFGKSKFAEVNNKVINFLNSCEAPQTFKQIWSEVSNDLDKMDSLTDIIRNLTAADKIFIVNGGFLAKRKERIDTTASLVDYSLLSEEERGAI